MKFSFWRDNPLWKWYWEISYFTGGVTVLSQDERVNNTWMD